MRESHPLPGRRKSGCGMRTLTFNSAAVAAGHPETAFRRVEFEHGPQFDDVGLERVIDRFPFVPDDPARLDRDCYEAFNIQVQGLMKRMRSICANG